MRRNLFILGLIAAFALGVMIWFYQAEPKSEASAADIPSLPIISACNGILVDGGSGEVLYEKQADTRGYPASTTKIMTALVTLDICEEQNISKEQKITIPPEAVGVEGSSMYLKKGEKKTIEEMLYGIMLVSGNDGATALASCMGGTVDNFVEKMNQKAEELGCSNTHFVNPTGLFDGNHYTTARDLAIISMEAMKNPTFAKVVGTTSWKNYHNKNKTVYQYEGGTGIKIGYTKASGRTLVASSKRQDTELICVLLNDGNWFKDAYSLMDYGFKLKGCLNVE